MKALVCLLIVSACMVVGCGTTSQMSTSTSEAAVAASASPFMGRTMQSVMAENDGHKIEIFNEDGEKVDAIAAKMTGSVSIYNADVSGQDNYTFDEKGMITKHLRSYGDDFAAGNWTEVK